MCDTNDCGIELKDLPEAGAQQERTEPTDEQVGTIVPGTQLTKRNVMQGQINLEKRFIAYIKDTNVEPLDVYRVVLDTTTGVDESIKPLYLLLTDGTVLVARNFDVVLRDMKPAKEVFDMLQHLEEQMIAGTDQTDKPEGYQ